MSEKSLPLRHLNAQSHYGSSSLGFDRFLSAPQTEEIARDLTRRSIQYAADLFVQARSCCSNQYFLYTYSDDFWNRVGAAAMHLSGGSVISYEHGLADPARQLSLSFPVVDHFLTRSEFEARHISQQLNEGQTALCVGGLSPEKWNTKMSGKAVSKETRNCGVLFIGNTREIESRNLIFETFEICRQQGFSFAYRPHPKMKFESAEELGLPLEFSSREGKRSLVNSARQWGIFIGEYSTALIEAKYFGARSIQLIDRGERKLVAPIDVSFCCDLAGLPDVLSEIKCNQEELERVSPNDVREKVFNALKELGVTSLTPGR